MACTIRSAGVVRTSALRRRPAAHATQRHGEGHGALRRAKHRRNARRAAVACRVASPTFASNDAPANGSPS